MSVPLDQISQIWGGGVTSMYCFMALWVITSALLTDTHDHTTISVVVVVIII